MSADRWSTCPRCVHRHEAKAAQLRADADAAYGKVSVEEWKLKDADAQAALKPLTGTHFREDYSFSSPEYGFVEAEYSGSCGVCGLCVSFKQTVPIEGIEA